MNEIIFIFMNLTFSMFLLEKQLIFNINTLDYFKYLYIDFKKNELFLQENNIDIFVKIWQKKIPRVRFLKLGF